MHTANWWTYDYIRYFERCHDIRDMRSEVVFIVLSLGAEVIIGLARFNYRPSEEKPEPAVVTRIYGDFDLQDLRRHYACSLRRSDPHAMVHCQDASCMFPIASTSLPNKTT